MSKIAHSLQDGRKRTSDIEVGQDNIYFDELLLSPDILKGLKEAGYSKPSPIQLQAIPLGKIGTGNN
jgi:superfamily II DNA/RNA helicase